MFSNFRTNTAFNISHASPVVLLVTAACRINPMIVTGENRSSWCRSIHHKISRGLAQDRNLGIRGDKPTNKRPSRKRVQSPPVLKTRPETVTKAGHSSSSSSSTMAVRPSVSKWQAAHHISCPSTCTFSFLHSADLREELHSIPHLSTQTWQKERYFSIV